MQFPLVGSGNKQRLGREDYEAIARHYNVPLAHLRAVVKIEAAGSGFTWGGLIKALYEGHVMYRNAGPHRNALVSRGLAWPKWNRKRYKKGTRAQHDQIAKAYDVAGDHALKAASYGLPQVLGENHAMCGFKTAGKMVTYMLEGEIRQLDVMMRFIKATGILAALRKGQWHKFARRYNGPKYKRNRYAQKLAAAVRLYKRSPDHGLTGGGNIRVESARQKQPDENVRDVQRALNKLGYGPIAADGWSGPKTSKAVRAFQEHHPDLANDGIIGPQTMAALDMALKHKAHKPVVEKATGLASVGGTAGVGAAATAVTVAQGLPWQVGAIIACLVVVGIVGLVAYRWWFKDRFDQEEAKAGFAEIGLTIPMKPWADRFGDGSQAEG